MDKKVMAFFHELKEDREYVRTRVERRIIKRIQTETLGGYFPSFKTILKEAMDEISLIIDENQKISMKALSVILQADEPDANCNKTMELCQSVRDAESQKKKESSQSQDLTEGDKPSAETVDSKHQK